MGYSWHYIVINYIIKLWLRFINANDVNMNGLEDFPDYQKFVQGVTLHTGIKIEEVKKMIMLKKRSRWMIGLHTIIYNQIGVIGEILLKP